MLGNTETQYIISIVELDFFARNIAASNALKELSEPSSGTRIFPSENNNTELHV